MLYTVVVTIGRNIGDIPMPSTTWDYFKTDVLHVLKSYATVLQYPPTGVSQLGVWDGRAEEAVTFVAHALSDNVHYIRAELRDRIKQRYQQEAIGFVTVPGTEHLI